MIDIKKLISKYKIQYSMLSQVGKAIIGFEELLIKNKIPLLKVSSDIDLPFKLNYTSPKTIGADRLALIAGAMLHNKNENTLVIDAGTCVTYDFIDNNNVYHGGAISPGLYLRFKSLNDYTENLPLLSISEKNIKLIGNDTKSSIQSGVAQGLFAEIEGIIVKYNLKYKNLTVFLTGGDKKLLDSYIKNKIFVGSKFLLLEGINYLLNFNKKNFN
jgi:type III pantothenate kinase